MTDDPEPRPQREGWTRGAAVAVVAAFVLGALPFAIWQVVSQPDEARYTVAAARMMATGDYIIPYAAWGEVRLLKPPLVYYQVVAGFALFGQSVFAVKSMWVLNAVVVLGLTWALARSLGASRTGALAALAALAANLLFFQGALTHNPDMPMVLGITLAMLGFVRLVSDDDPPRWAAWAAWLGVAWAFLAKGMLVFLLVALALGLRWAHGRLGRPGRNEIAALLAAAILSGWWWVVVAFREPAALMEQFFGDQVGRKAVFDLTGALEAFAGLGGFMVLGFLPFVLAAFPWRGLARPRLSPGVVLLGAWAGLVTLIFSFGIYQPPRYLLPALPGVAAILGLAFSQLAAEDLGRRGGRALRLLLPLTVLVVLLTAAIVYGGASVLAALGSLVAGLALVAALWWLAGRGRVSLALPLLALWLPVTLLATWPAARLIAFPAAADHGVAAVRASGLPTDAVVIFAKWRFLDRVGLRAPPIEGYRYANAFREDMLDGAGLVLTIEPGDAARLEALGWSVRVETGAPEGYADAAAGLVQVPGPAIGRAGGRRAGRVKTRLLGFDHSHGTDPFESGQAAPAAALVRFPVGWIVVVQGPGRGASFTLFNGVSAIGRGDDQPVKLDFGDTSISRTNHAVVAYDDEQRKFFLGHGGKANIVRLNGKPVLSTEELSHNDIIRIGETTLRFLALCGADFDWSDEEGTQGGDAGRE